MLLSYYDNNDDDEYTNTFSTSRSFYLYIHHLLTHPPSHIPTTTPKTPFTGTATHWPEFLLYNLETDEEEVQQEVKNAAVPYNNVGLLEVRWTPLAGPNPEDREKTPIDIEDPQDLLGKSWCYELEIKKASDLPVFCEMAYVR